MKNLDFIASFRYISIVGVAGFFFLAMITAVNSGYWFNPVTSTQSEPPFYFRGTIMQEDINHKICPTCKISKPLSDFYKHRRTKDGYNCYCKSCWIIYTSNQRRTNKTTLEKLRIYNRLFSRKYRANNIEKVREQERLRIRPKDIKYKCRYLLNTAVRDGRIDKPKNCSNCNKENRITAHHNDYTKPFNVVWLCYECHGILNCSL